MHPKHFRFTTEATPDTAVNGDFATFLPRVRKPAGGHCASGIEALLAGKGHVYAASMKTDHGAVREINRLPYPPRVRSVIHTQELLGAIDEHAALIRAARTKLLCNLVAVPRQFRPPRRLGGVLFHPQLAVLIRERAKATVARSVGPRLDVGEFRP